VQAAGYGCPLDPAAFAAVADEDGDNMRLLVEAMTQDRLYTFSEIVGLCRANECFMELVGEAEIENRARVALGCLLARYDERLVNDRRFTVEGKGHKRRYHVEIVERPARSHASHASTPKEPQNSLRVNRWEKRAERVERADGSADRSFFDVEV
jgi:hypothetical protein